MTTAATSGMSGREVNARNVQAERLALCALVAGVAYYLCFRTHAAPRALVWLIEFLPRGALTADPSLGTFPSFAHGLFCAALAVVFTHCWSQARLATLGALVVALVLEGCVGTPDPLDALALLCGAAFGLLRLGAWPRQRPASNGLDRAQIPRRAAQGRRRGAISAVCVSLVSAALILGSDYAEPGCARYADAGYCVEYKRFAKPVYLSYAALRSAVRVEPARPLDRIGQLHAISSWLFVGERNRGVHVIDNTDPATPLNVGFIRIPGNTEVVVRGNYLYADSYIDLVTLDVSDPRAVREIDRQVDVFPWDAFQNIPYDIGFRPEDVDASRGVVVSYAE